MRNWFLFRSTFHTLQHNDFQLDRNSGSRLLCPHCKIGETVTGTLSRGENRYFRFYKPPNCESLYFEAMNYFGEIGFMNKEFSDIFQTLLGQHLIQPQVLQTVSSLSEDIVTEAKDNIYVAGNALNFYN